MPVVVDAILAAVRTLAPDGVAVYDGPFVTSDATEAIHVGYDADPEGSFDAGTSEQEWAGLGAKKRDETLQVSGACVISQGDSDVKAARDGAYALLGHVEDAIHPFPAVGVSPPTWAGVTSHRLLYLPDPNVGLQAVITWVITIRTRP